MSKEAELLGKLLPAFPVVEQVREKYNIDRVSPRDDQLKEILKYHAEIDWQAVRQDIEDWIRNIPELLPPELAEKLMIIELGNKFPPEPVFAEDEDVTEWHKRDVIMIYAAFLKVYKAIQKDAENWQSMIDNCYSAITDSLLGYLLTGETRDIPQDWISNVEVKNVFGVEVVVVMASQYANPQETAEEFLRKHAETFGKDRPNITPNNLEVAPYLLMKAQGMVLKDIADEYIQENRAEFPKDDQSDEYKAQKRLLEDRLDTGMRRLLDNLDRVFPDRNFENPVP